MGLAVDCIEQSLLAFLAYFLEAALVVSVGILIEAALEVLAAVEQPLVLVEQTRVNLVVTHSFALSCYSAG